MIEKNLNQRYSLGMKKLVLRRTELKQLPRYLKFLCNYDELIRIEKPNPLEYSLGLRFCFLKKDTESVNPNKVLLEFKWKLLPPFLVSQKVKDDLVACQFTFL